MNLSYKRLTYYLVGLFCFPALVSSQILKIDKSHLATDSSNYFVGALDGTFSMDNSASNAEEQITLARLQSNVDIVYIGGKSATIMLNQLSFLRRSDQGRFLNNAAMHVRRVFKRADKLTPVAFFQIQYAQNRRLINRQLYGAGYQWNILRGRRSLHLGLIPFYEKERWNKIEDGNTSRNLPKMNLYLGGDIPITESFNINTITYLQSGFDHISVTYRNRILSFIEFKETINEKFRIKLTLDYSYDQRPLIEINKVTYAMNVGLEYRL